MHRIEPVVSLCIYFLASLLVWSPTMTPYDGRFLLPMAALLGVSACISIRMYQRHNVVQTVRVFLWLSALVIGVNLSFCEALIVVSAATVALFAFDVTERKGEKDELHK